jgi:hypothetical protein
LLIVDEGQLTPLDAIRNLSLLDADGVICASEPFTEESEVMIVPMPESGRLIEMGGSGFKYFLEVSIAREFLEDLVTSAMEVPTLPEKCSRLIYYAIFDA